MGKGTYRGFRKPEDPVLKQQSIVLGGSRGRSKKRSKQASKEKGPQKAEEPGPNREQ